MEALTKLETKTLYPAIINSIIVWFKTKEDRKNLEQILKDKVSFDYMKSRDDFI
jgi:hypothetical protein